MIRRIKDLGSSTKCSRLSTYWISNIEDVKHKGPSIKELRKLFKIYDLLDVKHKGHKGRRIRKLERLLKIYDKLGIKELRNSE